MRRFVLLAIVALFFAASAYAQRSTGSIRGVVKDATQAVLPGATVTVTNEETGLLRTTVTNTSGVYSVADLPVGVPSRFDLVLNLKAAEAIGLTFPSAVLSQATQIIR